MIGEVHPHPFGNFAEHLGRCIYGGLYDEGSPLHTYIGNRDNNLEKFLSASQDIDHRIEVVEGLIRAAQSGRPNARPIHKVTHTSGDDRKVRPTVRSVTLAIVEGEFHYTFPAHSLTILKLRVK